MADDQTTPLANPAPLGLVGFGLTTVLLSLINAHLLPKGGNDVVIPLALAYGGLVQGIAGLMEFRTGNTFGMVAFMSFGAFWWWFALLELFAGNGLLDLSKAGPTVGIALLLWGVFTFYMWIASFRVSVAVWLVFLTLWITFALLGLGDAFGAAQLGIWGGYVGLASGALAMYTSFAEVTNATFGSAVMPVGPLARAPAETPVVAGH